MMLGLHNRPCEVPGGYDVFVFQLAETLGMTVSQVEQMPYQEYVNWSAYLTAKNAIANKKEVRA